MQKLHCTLIAAFAALAMLSASAHASQSSYVKKENLGICFENVNTGARISFFVYKDGAKAYRPGHDIWAYRGSDGADGRTHCVKMDELKGTKLGDYVVAGWQVEGKRFGEHSFVCGGSERLNPAKTKNIKFYITGRTIWDTGCRREETLREHSQDQARLVAASEICFRTDYADDIANGSKKSPLFVLYSEGREVWRWIYRKSPQTMRCAKLWELKHMKPGYEVGATLSPIHTVCPGKAVADYNSKTRVVYKRRIENKWTMKCVRSLEVVRGK
ncbi:MAG: hypothetical protein ACR2P7_02790 [bacterium]